MSALLNVDNYYLEELTIKANPDFNPKEADKGDVGISFDIKRNGSKPQFMISMATDVNRSKKSFSCASYQVSLRVTGFFSFPEGTDEETIKNMIALNGLSILYGLARGTVAHVTASCPHGKFILPSVNFVELVKKKLKSSTKKSKKHVAK